MSDVKWKHSRDWWQPRSLSCKSAHATLFCYWDWVHSHGTLDLFSSFKERSVCHVPGTVLGAGTSAVSSQTKIPAFVNLTSWRRGGATAPDKHITYYSGKWPELQRDTEQGQEVASSRGWGGGAVSSIAVGFPLTRKLSQSPHSGRALMAG